VSHANSRHYLQPLRIRRAIPGVLQPSGARAVNVVIAALYAATLWLSCVAYALIIGHGAGEVIAFGPLIISAATLALLLASLVIEFAAKWARWAWLSLGTVRLRPWPKEK
jgi:hypothetical protein